MLRPWLVSIVVILSGLTSSAHSSDRLSVQDVLNRRIIEPDLPLSEVQDYVEARVPPMPDPRSVAEWEASAEHMRQQTLDKVVFRGEAAPWRRYQGKVEWLDTLEAGSGYQIKKLRYEALPGLWIPALLYEPTNISGKVPVVLNVNGHDRANGKAARYKQVRCINQAKRGMLALNVEWLGMGQLNTPDFVHYRMNQLDLCGTSGLAPFYLSMSRGIDVLLSHEHADPDRVAVAGLSGGGWQTIFISSLDKRVTLSNPVAGYSSFRTRARNLSDLGDSEQTPCDMATVTDYAQLTAMRAPRPTLLTFNAADNCCFKAAHALPPLLAAARPVYELYGKRDYLRAHVNFEPGNHNFEQDNREALYRMLGEFFFAGSAGFNPAEIRCQDEIKTKEQLHVELPDSNAGFHTLALRISKSLPRMQNKGQDSRRQALRQIVRSKDYTVDARQTDRFAFANGQATLWKLGVGQRWTVPAVELVRGTPESTVILVADGGRKSAAAQAEALLAAGQRVLAVDPFYLGESRISSRDFLFALLISTIGDRPLGLQASQVAAIARWANGRYGVAPRIVAVGPRSSLFALVAAALEKNGIAGVQLHESLGSLKAVLERDMTVRETPELFCFGLLEQFDIPQIAELVAPREVRFAKQ